MPPDPRLTGFFKLVTLERGLVAGGVGRSSLGVGLLLAAVNQWRARRLRRASTTPHHALGHPRRDADRARLPDHPLQLLRQHPGHAAEVTAMPDADVRSRQRRRPSSTPYAADYDARAQPGALRLRRGQGRTSPAGASIGWQSCLRRARRSDPATVIDFGCGTGSATPLFLELSRRRRARRRRRLRASRSTSPRRATARPARAFRLIERLPAATATSTWSFCNGVFHHIPPAERRRAPCGTSTTPCGPAGCFALWENNPWNPGTRYVMSRIPFDRDAITLSAARGPRLLRGGGLRGRCAPTSCSSSRARSAGCGRWSGCSTAPAGRAVPRARHEAGLLAALR